ncbi:hypothetical protein A2296_02645 [candidate division CPR3 bacterium RIFOXYB2_FULL_35_8]|nr:MAG: hypothetical protein A2250_00065 [candidate division CPR3 bacterium RIFOXYA2_FULL_35_13]OGB76608.1 MAG: hypothetical protein A2476_01860 [candidate division CPR3 bacterium RIFOXYC2_FULL_35_7]OGB79062.1 MAG: hypothetical protein A2296_02645 [candidate division CPR3 bacterium RIFOXYB2_FULL_35_8]
MNVKDLPYPKIGDAVKVVQKDDYPTGKLTAGIVKDILTKFPGHPRGTKVRLENGVIGRIQEFGNDNGERPLDKQLPMENQQVVFTDVEDLV